MSRLVYNRSTNTITLYASDGTQIGQWTAHNNAASTSNGRFPAGTHAFSWHNPHAGGSANSAYGSNGNFIFNVPGRTGMGVHSGRATSTDGAGRTGTQHATMGCIRTTDAATSQIQTTHATDAVTELQVTD